MKFEKREMVRGDSLSFEVPIINPTTGGPLDITGAKLWFTAKHNYVDPDERAAIKLNTVDGGVVITDAPRGKARIDIEPIHTRSFPDGIVRLVYDVQIKDAAGYVTTLEAGTIKIYPDVSRAIV